MQNNQVQEMQTRKKRKGFTLAELVVVVAILAVLAVILVPRISIMTEQARVQAFESNYAVLQSAIHSFMNANGNEIPGLDGEDAGEQLIDYIADDIDEDEFDTVFEYFNGKPKNAEYEYEEGVLTCTLTGVGPKAVGHVDGADSQTYKGKYDPDEETYILKFTPKDPTTTP